MGNVRRGDQGQASSSAALPTDTMGSEIDAEEVLASALRSRLTPGQRGPLSSVDFDHVQLPPAAKTFHQRRGDSPEGTQGR